MKNLLLTVLFTSAIAISAAAADNLPTPAIAVVEQATLDKSAALKSIVSQVEKKRAEVQKEMSKYEAELKAEDKKLSEEQSKLSEKDFAAKKQAFEKKVQGIQEKLEIRRVQMELAVEEAKKKVYEAFIKVADQIKTEAGANIILYKETIVTADKAFDLTDKVLDQLNKALPSVQVVYKSEADVKAQLMQSLQAQQK